MKTLVSALAVAGLAGSAFGISADTIDRTNQPMYDQSNLPAGVTITAIPLDGRVDDRVGSPIYENLAAGSGYLANPAFSGTISIEDYATSLSDGASDGVDGTGGLTANLVEFGFVGGVSNTNTGKTVFFDFFDTNLAAVSGFGVTLANFGNFIYTITITDPNLNPVPVEGFMLMSSAVGTNAQHFLSDAAPAVGFTGKENEQFYGPGFFDFDYGNGNGPVNIDFLFRLNVPTPGTAALFGLAGLAGIRRRR
jgi:hypothetical protein